MLRHGEFDSNNQRPSSTQSFLGFGEYDNRKEELMNQRKADYAQHQYAEKVKLTADHENRKLSSSSSVSNQSNKDKASQTILQNVQSHLVQYEHRPRTTDEITPAHNYNGETSQIEMKNNYVLPENSKYGHSFMDMYGNAVDIESSPRDKHMADLQSSCFPKIPGSPYVNTDDQEKAEKQRRQESYHAELDQQIQEKHRMAALHKREELEEDRRHEIENQLKDINIDEKHVSRRQSYLGDVPKTQREKEDEQTRKNFQ